RRTAASDHRGARTGYREDARLGATTRLPRTGTSGAGQSALPGSPAPSVVTIVVVVEIVAAVVPLIEGVLDMIRDGVVPVFEPLRTAGDVDGRELSGRRPRSPEVGACGEFGPFRGVGCLCQRVRCCRRRGIARTVFSEGEARRARS